MYYMKNKLQIDIFSSVTSKEIREITSELIEAGLDQFIDDGFLKDIPVIGSAFKMVNMTQKISDFFFTKKILKFLFEFKDISLEQRTKFIEKFENTVKTKKIGEKTLIILNKLDDADKATILGKLFKSAIEGEIEMSEFIRLSHIVDRAYLDDLNALKENDFFDNLSLETKLNLYQINLANQKIKDNRDHEEYVFKATGTRKIIPPSYDYELNSYGEMLKQYGF